MGVDFDDCDDCGESTCDQNITYMDIPVYGKHKTCSICLETYFDIPDEDDEELCVDVLDDASDEEDIIFYYVLYKETDDRCDYTENDLIGTSHYASDARGWIRNYDTSKPIAVGWYEGWKPKPKAFHAYDPEDGTLPIVEAAHTYDIHFKDSYGYSAIKSRAREDPKPNYRWKQEHTKRLDQEIEHLQDKRRRINKL